MPVATSVEILENYVGGAWTPSRATEFVDVHNPARGEVIAKTPLSTRADLDTAVAAAARAFPAWRDTPVVVRARAMFRFKALLEEHAEELARLVTTEHGKTLDESRGSVRRAIECVEVASAAPSLMMGYGLEQIASGIDCTVLRQPLGVVAAITPFNFPAMVPMWMYPIAVACGNTFVLKPSEKDPTASMVAFELFKEAGFPKGVLNIVHGDKEVVDAILAHPDIKAVSFVGSTPVAEHVFARGSASGKRVQALGGAKNHMIVMPDADMDQAVDALMGAGFGSAGERCMAISVAVPVGEKTADRLVEALVPKIRTMKVGPATDPQSEMGPVITAQAKRRIEGLIGEGVSEGATLVVDGRGLKLQGYENGFFLGGTLFDRVTKDMTIYREEIFGPVLCVVRTERFDEAADLVNSHEYGNGTAIFTRDGDTARAFAASIEVGMVGINVPIPVPVAYHSFGGWKRSLFGDHSIYGPEGVRFYTRLKTVTARWPNGIRAGAEFNFPSLK